MNLSRIKSHCWILLCPDRKSPSHLISVAGNTTGDISIISRDGKSLPRETGLHLQQKTHRQTLTFLPLQILRTTIYHSSGQLWGGTKMTRSFLSSTVIARNDGGSNHRGMSSTNPVTAVKQDDSKGDKSHRAHQYQALGKRRPLGNKTIACRPQ